MHSAVRTDLVQLVFLKLHAHGKYKDIPQKMGNLVESVDNIHLQECAECVLISAMFPVQRFLQRLLCVKYLHV